MLTLKIRKAIVYAATGMFFFVAASAQVQGVSGIDPFIKAGVSCLVLTILGMVFVRVLEDAMQRVAAADQRAVATGNAAPAGAVAAARQPGKE